MDISYLSGVFASPWDIIRSIVDIAIVSYVIYRLLGLITGTRAQQLLKGLVLLLAFTVAASYFKLTMVNWLVQKLWIMFAIVLPIVFQPELRRFLEQLGRGRFFSSRHYENDGYNIHIEEIVNAVEELSRRRTGALMVLSRDTDIGEYLESGTIMDAHITCSLLLNLFYPNSPLHDGAVIVRNWRIERAGCFLPLTVNPSLNRELG
ncbi:MAG: diadenylate cyclase, partial [Deltaproteobacteria bacterium]